MRLRPDRKKRAEDQSGGRPDPILQKAKPFWSERALTKFGSPYLLAETTRKHGKWERNLAHPAATSSAMAQGKPALPGELRDLALISAKMNEVVGTKGDRRVRQLEYSELR